MSLSFVIVSLCWSFCDELVHSHQSMHLSRCSDPGFSNTDGDDDDGVDVDDDDNNKNNDDDDVLYFNYI